MSCLLNTKWIRLYVVEIYQLILDLLCLIVSRRILLNLKIIYFIVLCHVYSFINGSCTNLIERLENRNGSCSDRSFSCRVWIGTQSDISFVTPNVNRTYDESQETRDEMEHHINTNGAPHQHHSSKIQSFP